MPVHTVSSFTSWKRDFDEFQEQLTWSQSKLQWRLQAVLTLLASCHREVDSLWTYVPWMNQKGKALNPCTCCLSLQCHLTRWCRSFLIYTVRFFSNRLLMIHVLNWTNNRQWKIWTMSHLWIQRLMHQECTTISSQYPHHALQATVGTSFIIRVLHHLISLAFIQIPGSISIHHLQCQHGAAMCFSVVLTESQ